MAHLSRPVRETYPACASSVGSRSCRRSISRHESFGRQCPLCSSRRDGQDIIMGMLLMTCTHSDRYPKGKSAWLVASPRWRSREEEEEEIEISRCGVHRTGTTARRALERKSIAQVLGCMAPVAGILEPCGGNRDRRRGQVLHRRGRGGVPPSASTALAACPVLEAVEGSEKLHGDAGFPPAS